jgi:hypothetical protein
MGCISWARAWCGEKEKHAADESEAGLGMEERSDIHDVLEESRSRSAEYEWREAGRREHPGESGMMSRGWERYILAHEMYCEDWWGGNGGWMVASKHVVGVPFKHGER